MSSSGWSAEAFGLGGSLLGSDPAIDDLFQEVLMVAWPHERFRPRARLWSVAAGIAGILRWITGRRERASGSGTTRVLDLLDAIRCCWGPLLGAHWMESCSRIAGIAGADA